MIRAVVTTRRGDLLRMAEHQREAGRKCLALALSSDDATVSAALLEMAFDYEGRASQFEIDAGDPVRALPAG